MSLLVETTAKVTLIVLFALALMPLLRNRAAALRHWMLAAALVCAAVSPIVRLVIPAWHLPVGFTASERGVAVPSAGPRVETSVVVLVDPQEANARVLQRPAPREWAGASLSAALRVIWMSGAALGLAALALGLSRLRRLASRARRLSEGVWVRHAEEIRREYGLRPVTMLLSTHSTLLITWGVLRPRILLPAGAHRWREDRVRLVLLHELAHVARGDWVVQLAAELMRCVYWFNPLIWIACGRLRRESEQACDDAVLNRGVEGAEYATHLVNIARELQRRPMWVPAPSIVRTSNLERRVRVMLDAGVNRRPISRSASVAALLALLTVTIPVTGAALGQAVFATVSGSIVDPTNASLPGVTVALTNPETQAKYEVRSDSTGRYEFVGVAAGEYVFRAALPGFAAFERKLTIAGQNVQQDLTLEVGKLSEAITVRASKTADTRLLPARDPGLIERRRRSAAECGSTAALRDRVDQTASRPAEEGLRVGGSIRPPFKLYDVRPQYPASMINAGIEGIVILEGRIGIDGTVEEVKVVRTPHADLADAAVEAVRQWEFSATLLNCVPIPVSIGITVNFQKEG